MAQKLSQKEVNAIIKEFIKKLQINEKLPISKVFLFGSYAKKTPHSKSDIDICIISPRFKDRLSASGFLNKKFYHDYNIPSPVSFDIIGYPPQDFTIDSPLVYEILKTGKRVGI